MGCGCSFDKGADKRLFHASYILGFKLGSGAHGQVRLAYKTDTLEEFAVKISVLKKTKQGPIDRGLLQASQNEAALASRMGKHPHIVQVVEFLQESHLSYLIMERCQSSLMDMMKSNSFSTQHDLLHVMRQMLLGISHCHGLRVVHRDVKPENFMFGGPEGKTLKLCDFGVAKALPAGGYLTGISGTAPYMAPEVVCKEAYNEKVDVWSFGTVAYLMLFGHFPYMPKTRDSNAFKEMIRLGVPKPHFAMDKRGAFARVLLERSKEKRCNAREALELEFLNPQESEQQMWPSEVESAAFEAGAADRDVCDADDTTVQHRLDELLDRLQMKHRRIALRNPTKPPTTESAASAAPAFHHFSEGPSGLPQTDDESRPVEPRIRRSSSRLSTHTGILRVVPVRLKSKLLSQTSAGSTATPEFSDIGSSCMSWSDVAKGHIGNEFNRHACPTKST